MFSRANLDAAFRQAFGVGVGVAQYEHKSAVLGCNMVVSVIDPSCHLKKNCPVVYWLSGLTCTDRNFVEKAGAVEAAVMIDAELSFWCIQETPCRAESPSSRAHSSPPFVLLLGAPSLALAPHSLAAPGQTWCHHRLP
jgi:hypothetical protein